jgi:pimeloyl-ACP methyl ester carboxylesterase
MDEASGASQATVTDPRIPLHHEVAGEPSAHPTLLLVHGGGSTIVTNWSALLPLVTPTRRVVAVELQGHGRTPATDRAAGFDRSADDVAALLGELGEGPVDVLGFSNGGTVAIRLAERHPQLVRRLILASTPFARAGMVDGFWEGLEAATLDDMPDVYRGADLAIHGSAEHLQRLFDLDRELMLGLEDVTAEELATVTAPTLVVGGDRDVVRVEHLVELARLLPDARLLVLPATHGDYLGEAFASGGDDSLLAAALPLLLRFLDEG